MVDKLAQDVVQLLRQHNLRVSFAESCTGGMVSAAITSVSGASEVLDLSITTYANPAKIQYTDVTDEVLSVYGAVSSQTALLMAQGIKARADADIGVGITGIAGPDGGTVEKPVGTVYVAVNSNVKHFLFTGNRKEIREQTTIHALMMCRDAVHDI